MRFAIGWPECFTVPPTPFTLFSPHPLWNNATNRTTLESLRIEWLMEHSLGKELKERRRASVRELTTTPTLDAK
jgi:hypothetical protein